jgi:hypothetical protein
MRQLSQQGISDKRTNEHIRNLFEINNIAGDVIRHGSNREKTRISNTVPWTWWH